MKEIMLTKGKVTIVDDEDYDWLNEFKWCCGYGYAVRGTRKGGNRKVIRMHRAIYEHHHGDIPAGLFIDHVDRNPLNNQLNNLRLATVQENNRNQSRYKNNTSGIVGVCKEVRRYKRKDGSIYTKSYWYAQVRNTKDKVRKEKRFPFSEEGKELATAWVSDMRLKLFKEFAPDLAEGE